MSYGKQKKLCKSAFRGAKKGGYVFLCFLSFSAYLASASTDSGLSFEYAPAKWQTAICLPDDPNKSVVDHEGKLLYHYYKPGGAFSTKVQVIAKEDAALASQQLLSPRIPIVITTRKTGTLSIVEETFAVPYEGNEISGSSRNDVILVSVTNHGAALETLRPEFFIKSRGKLTASEERAVRINQQASVLSTHPVEKIVIEKRQHSVARMMLEPFEIKVGKTHSFALVFCCGETPDTTQVTIETVRKQRHNAEEYWLAYPFLFDAISIPDSGIQSLIDSAVRNIWQAREIKNGLPAFQVGPSCYRGLWMIDGAFILETATLLGAAEDARAGIAYMLSKQQPSGAFELLTPTFYKENGIVLWTCVRHARLTRDKAWLLSIWPKLEKTVGFIKTLRERSYDNPDWFCHGLIPPGETDGGLWHNEKGEYSNVYWNLIGLKTVIEGALWLGLTEQAHDWQKEYEDFYTTFRTVAARDMCVDSAGNQYLPITMQNIGKALPQRAQWSFCHSVYPGRLFEKHDPLVSGNLAMLEATEQEGLVCGTGWDPEGLWTHFASFYAHAWLWEGNGIKACDLLYAFANHASPLLVWREEQSLQDKPYRQVGDMPHNWASAEFIRLAIHLLAFERGNELHLFEGMPAAWAQPGMTTALNNIATVFGPLTFKLTLSENGDTAYLKIQPLTDACCEKIVLHLDVWTGVKRNTTIDLNPGREHFLQISCK